MTGKDKLEKLKKLADAMYYAANYLTTDASRLHKAMEEYHKFIINEYHKEEPVSIDFELELYKAFGQVENFTLGMRITKWFYDMGKNSQEPLSEELEDAVNAYIGYAPEVDESSSTYGKRHAFKAGAKWQKEQLMAKAVKVNISNASIVSLPVNCNLKVGDKVLIIKEE